MIPILLVFILAISFNQPRFCLNASWNPNATTLILNNTIGFQPYTLFIAHPQNGQILIWYNGTLNLTTTISANLSAPSGLFVTDDEEIFVYNGSPNNRVDRWISNGTRLTSPMSVCSPCYGLFVDSNNNLYCSQADAHQVVRRPLQNPSIPTTIVVGTGCGGSTATTLSYPWGIFVTDQFDLYVADWGNNRIQMFREGEIDGRTVPINGSNGITMALNNPTGVMLDGDGYLFIVDSWNRRIIGSDRWGWRCVVGCFGGGGSAFNRLSYPVTMNFDADGNLLVLNTNNSRVQKF